MLLSSILWYGLYIPVILARKDQYLCSLTAENKEEGFFERGGIYFRICFPKDIGLFSILNSQKVHAALLLYYPEEC